MPIYRKKPVEIAAEPWDGATSEAYRILAWITGNGGRASLASGYRDQGPDALAIETLEGVMTANPGDVIIRGIQGEFYPCKPDIFEATYDRVA